MSKFKLLRYKYLLFPKFQLTLLGANLIVFVATGGLIWLNFSLAIDELRVVGIGHGPIADYYRKFLEYQADRLQTTLALTLLGGAVICAACTVIVSHRFSGPMVNLKAFFERLTANPGQRQNLKFRKGDFLEELPPLINEALNRVESEARQKPGDTKAA